MGNMLFKKIIFKFKKLIKKFSRYKFYYKIKFGSKLHDQS